MQKSHVDAIRVHSMCHNVYGTCYVYGSHELAIIQCLRAHDAKQCVNTAYILPQGIPRTSQGPLGHLQDPPARPTRAQRASSTRKPWAWGPSGAQRSP